LKRVKPIFGALAVKVITNRFVMALTKERHLCR